MVTLQEVEGPLIEMATVKCRDSSTYIINNSKREKLYQTFIDQGYRDNDEIDYMVDKAMGTNNPKPFSLDDIG